jgi:hypothetical protein
MRSSPTMSPWEEHRFWVEIMLDHSIFVDEALAPEEGEWISVARQYISSFTELLHRIDRTDPSLPTHSEAMVQLSREIYPVANGYFQFEGNLQRLRMENKIVISLTPVYFNGTLLENEEYLRILSYTTNGAQHEELPLVLLVDMWLEDQLGHAVLLRNHLDPAEIEFSRRAEQFSQQFQAHIIKNNSIYGYLRFTRPGFPIQQRFAREVAESIIGFYHFARDVIDQFEHTELLSRLTLRFLEHHLPETCYFLKKLAAYDKEIYSLPGCPLTQPTYPAI